jgi:hypothetical protein
MALSVQLLGASSSAFLPAFPVIDFRGALRRCCNTSADIFRTYMAFEFRLLHLAATDIPKRSASAPACVF